MSLPPDIMPSDSFPDTYIDFDGRQLIFRTDIAEVHGFIERTFRHMLVPTLNASSGVLTVYRKNEGFTMHGAESRDFPHAALEHLLPLIKDEVRLQFMRSRPDLLWLHAGAVERDGKALLLAAPSGQGKSTLTTKLCEGGWRLLSDDVAPVRMEVDVVLPFPQTPVRRLHPGYEVSPDELRHLDRETVSLTRDLIATGEASICGVLFVLYEAGAALDMTRLPQGSAALELLRNLTNFIDHKSAAVWRAADLARRLPIFSLRYSLAEDAVATIDGVQMSQLC